MVYSDWIKVAVGLITEQELEGSVWGGGGVLLAETGASELEFGGVVLEGIGGGAVQLGRGTCEEEEEAVGADSVSLQD